MQQKSDNLDVRFPFGLAMETFPTGSGVSSQGCAMPEEQNAQSVSGGSHDTRAQASSLVGLYIGSFEAT